MEIFKAIIIAAAIIGTAIIISPITLQIFKLEQCKNELGEGYRNHCAKFINGANNS